MKANCKTFASDKQALKKDAVLKLTSLLFSGTKEAFDNFKILFSLEEISEIIFIQLENTG